MKSIAMKKLELAQAVVLSNRKEYGNGIVTHDALSSDGQETYTVTCVDGKATGCECKSHRPCKHMLACEREEAFLAEFTAPSHEEEVQVAEMVAAEILGQDFAQDLIAHIEDDIRTGALAYSCPCCGGKTKREVGPCGRCLDFAA